jgi:hypothetical protein
MKPDEITKGPGYPTSIFGSAGTNAAWSVVYRAYLEDRVEAGYRAALDLGTAATSGTLLFYRQLEAEAETRRHSTIHRPNEWLHVEGREVADSSVQADIAAAIENTAHRFGFTDRPDTMVSILISEVDTPWAVGRAGYFVDKIPYDKICLPEAALSSCRQFCATLAHEYAHLIALHLAEGHAPRWLNEAFATLSEGYPTERAVEAIRAGSMPWRSERDLDVAFVAPENDRQGLSERHGAYSQAAVMAKYLQNLKGDEGFANLLRGFANNPFWKDLAMSVTGQEPVDEALREVYGFGVRDLFARSKPQ